MSASQPPRRRAGLAPQGGRKPLHRRSLLAAVGATLLPGRQASAGRAPGARAGGDAATLLVPGPADGSAARWGTRLVEASLAGPLRLAPVLLGGADGVTAANRFAAEARPDGRTMLLLTGTAAQARLVGEQRARFDPAGWLPVCGALGDATLFGVGPLRGRERPIRLALPAAEAPETAALLWLDLAGIAAVPVLGLGAAASVAALAEGRVDAAVLRSVPALECQPWFSLGESGPRDGLVEPMPGGGPLLVALAATAMASRLTGVLVLPALTDANLVAHWRAVAKNWSEASETARRLDGPEAAAALAVTAPGPEAMLAYREWSLQRFGQQPRPDGETLTKMKISP